jgi:hypothetical protein
MHLELRGGTIAKRVQLAQREEHRVSDFGPFCFRNSTEHAVNGLHAIIAGAGKLSDGTMTVRPHGGTEHWHKLHLELRRVAAGAERVGGPPTTTR